MAAKKNSKNDSQKIVLVAAVLATIFIIFTYGGQLTGQAVYNGTVEVTVSAVTTCNIEYNGNNAWTTGAGGENISCTKAAGVTDSQCGNVINSSNTGSVAMTVNLTIEDDASSYFTHSSLDLDGVDITSVESSQAIWTVAGQATESGDYFLVTTGATETAGEYDITFNLECDFT